MCDDDGLLVGTGSACSSKKAALNRILLAMNKNRQDIDKILNKLELSNYDEIEILKRTNGKCFTDEIEVR